MSTGPGLLDPSPMSTGPGSVGALPYEYWSWVMNNSLYFKKCWWRICTFLRFFVSFYLLVLSFFPWTGETVELDPDASGLLVRSKKGAL